MHEQSSAVLESLVVRPVVGVVWLVGCVGNCGRPGGLVVGIMEC